MKKVEIYVVTAYRWGEQKEHSYVIGVFTSKWAAMKCADSHCEYRGGKYGCVVDEVKLNSFDNTSDKYSKEIYRARSVRN